MAVADIILGPAKVWYAPVGEPYPDENDVGYGEDWGGEWTPFGFTKAALSINYEYETFKAMVQEALGPVKKRKTSEELTAETTLAEVTADNLALGTEGTVTQTAAGPGQAQKEELEAGGTFTLTPYTFGFEGLYETDDGEQFPVRFFIHRGTVSLGGALEFGKEDYPGITLHIEADEDLSRPIGKRLFKFQRVLAAATV